MAVIDQCITEKYAAYNGDSCELLPTLPDQSAHLVIYSPPFADLYNYSSSERDLSNCRDYDQFLEHYGFIVRQLARLTKAGRVNAVHCCDIPIPGQKQGYRDFPGDIIRLHQEAGFNYQGRICIWKEPFRVAMRTRLQHLTHKWLVKDSSFSFPAGGDYLLLFKRQGQNAEPVHHRAGLSVYVGDREIPVELLRHEGDERQQKNKLSQWIWRQYASCFWDDIRLDRVLPYKESRDPDDEKHVCLARNSLILTKERGYVPIQEVVVGEHSLTHRGRWKKIVAVQCTGVRQVISVNAHGVPGLTLTPDHKLWMRQSSWARERDGAESSEPCWIEAQSSLPGGYVNLKLPDVEQPLVADCAIWKIVGRWLACGHWEARGSASISCGDEKLPSLREMLGVRLGAERHTGTAYQVRILDRNGEIREILRRCGDGAAGKHIPPDAVSLPIEQAKALLDGYLSGDGHLLDDRQRWTGSTVSRQLALGIAILAQRVYGSIASVYAGRPERYSVIEGRQVHCQQDWMLSFDMHKNSRRQKPFILPDGAWKKVRSVEDAGEVETWNLRVEEDESYTAEGCIVKNCPLQLDVIERAMALWSNPGDVVLTPFMGVGSEVYGAVKHGRRGVGVELKPSYYRQALKNLESAARDTAPAPTLFDEAEATA